MSETQNIWFPQFNSALSWGLLIAASVAGAHGDKPLALILGSLFVASYFWSR